MDLSTLNEKRLVRRFLSYVKIGSESGQERDFCKKIISDLKKIGLKPRPDRSGNILARINGEGPAILLNAHLDTVSPGKKIKPKIRKGIIKSSGKTILGADNKAGVAAIVEALTILKENRIPHGEILLIFTVQEEIGLLGSKALNSKKIKADFGFVFDGGEPSVINHAAPSQKNIEAWITGKAAHAGVHPEDGISAIIVASEAIAKMKLGRIDRETTANIGVISGGKATNIIPDKVYLKGEARSHDPFKLKKQLGLMSGCLKKSCQKHEAKVKIEIKDMYRAFKIAPRERVLRIAKAAANNLGLKTVIKPSGGGSDANIFNSIGIKSIILGAGAHAIHGTKEKLVIKELVLGERLVLEIIKECSKKH